MMRQREGSMRMLSLAALLLLTTSAHAHDQWNNGKPIEDWINAGAPKFDGGGKNVFVPIKNVLEAILADLRPGQAISVTGNPGSSGS